MDEQLINRKWIEYTEGPALILRPDRIYVSLSKRGEFFVNRKGFEELGSPAAVVLLYDPETLTIGLRPAPADTVNAFKMCPTHCGAKLVCSTGFMQRHSIRLNCRVRVRFPTARIEHGVLVLELRLGIPVISRPKRNEQTAVISSGS